MTTFAFFWKKVKRPAIFAGLFTFSKTFILFIDYPMNQ